MSSGKLFGTNGIRGLTNKELTPEMAIKVGSAIGTFFDRKNLLVGYDARISGPMFSKAVISGLTATGCTTYLAGMAPTPALQYAIKNHQMDGGVIITASHNPPEYNGIKVIWNDGIEISHEQEIEIEKIFFESILGFLALSLKFFKELFHPLREYQFAISAHDVSGEAVVSKVFNFPVVHEEEVFVSEDRAYIGVGAKSLLFLDRSPSSCEGAHDFLFRQPRVVYRENSCLRHRRGHLSATP
jgi:hypothetical protein